MYKIFSKFTLLTLLLAIFILPVISNAADPLVPCGNSVTDEVGTYIENPCDFNDFVLMINEIINWIISIAGVIFAITLIYGGFLYMTSGDNPGNKTKATDMMWNTLKGFVIILVAWVIVYTILNTLVVDGSSNSIFHFLKK